jgi:small subunit ribosomal protein S8
MSYTDFLIQIKNAQNADKDSLKLPYSKMDKSIADILETKGFLKKIEVKGRKPKKIIKIYLNHKKPISGVQFVSKPSRQIYKNHKEIKPVKSGYGLLVLSTSEGIMTGTEARKKKIGGQLLFKLW